MEMTTCPRCAAEWSAFEQTTRHCQSCQYSVLTPEPSLEDMPAEWDETDADLLPNIIL